MLDQNIRKFVDIPLDQSARLLRRFAIHPNLVTTLGFVIGLLGVLATAFSLYWLGLILVLCNRVLDGLDGAIARQQQSSTAVGGYLDIVLDFIFYSAVPLGFALANIEQNAVSALIVMLSFMGTGSSFLAYAIFIEKFNIDESTNTKKSFVYARGLMEGSETIIAFVAFYLFPQHFWWLALVVALLCFVTTVGRIVETCFLLQGVEQKIEKTLQDKPLTE